MDKRRNDLDYQKSLKEELERDLQKRIEVGKSLMNVEISRFDQLVKLRKEYCEWDDYNFEFIKGAYSPFSGEYYKRSEKALVESFIPFSLQVDQLKKEIEAKIDHLKLLKKKLKLWNSKKKIAKDENASHFIFIGHGRSRLWKSVENFLIKKLKLETINYESEPRAGESIVQILEGFLEKSVLAIIVFTAEDRTAEGKLWPRPNVIHELGLFQGKLGFRNVILLRQKGIDIEDLSNVAGLQRIDFDNDNIESTFDTIRGILEERGFI